MQHLALLKWTSLDSCEPAFQACPGPFLMASLLSVVWTAPLSLLLSENLVRMHSIPLSMSLIRMLKSACPKMDPWTAPLVTSFHLDIELLTPALWLQPPSQSFIYWTFQPSNVYLSSLEIRPCASSGIWHLAFLYPPVLSLHHRKPQDLSGTVCPWWSCAGCLKSPLCLACALVYLSRGSAPSSAQAQRWGSSACNSVGTPFSLSLKWEWLFSFSPMTGNFTWQAWLYS